MMFPRTMLCLTLVVFVTAATAAAQTPSDPARDAQKAKLLAASRQRVTDAEKAVEAARKLREAAGAKYQALEKQMLDLAAKLGATSDAQAVELTARIDQARAQLKQLEEQGKKLAPGKYATVPEMLERDAQADARNRLNQQRNELERQIQGWHGAYLNRLAELLGGKEQAAVVVGDWRKQGQALGQAQGEFGRAQARRLEVARAEAALANGLNAPAPKLEGAQRWDAPEPADAAARRSVFAQRQSPEAVRALGERFFGQMTLTLPGLEKVRELAAVGQYGPALDAYKRYYFAKLVPDSKLEVEPTPAGDEDEPRGDGEAANQERVPLPPHAVEIERALQGLVRTNVPGADKTSTPLDVYLGKPGAIPWTFATAGDDWKLGFCQQLGNPLELGAVLRKSYLSGGPKEHLLAYAELLDDWAMNWQRDVEQSPLPMRGAYNMLIACRIQALRGMLANVARTRPSFVEDFPAATLARLLMATNEEYLSASLRLGRSGLYNFRIMMLNSVVPTSLQMQEFHAHQWALREAWRQVDNNFIYKIRRDGANFEFANDGHENTDQSMLMHVGLLKSLPATPAWLDPYWDAEFTENFLQNTRYWVHNLKPDGFSYRLNARTQRSRYEGERPEYKIHLLKDEPEVWRRMAQVFGFGPAREKPKVVSESMAFQGYYYLRGGWKPDDYFLYFQSINQPILSGREDATGIMLYAHGLPAALIPGAWVDGKVQNIHALSTSQGGGKANYYNYGLPDAVKPYRFHAGERFDFCEGAFEGPYNYARPNPFYYPFGMYGSEKSLARATSQAEREGKKFVDTPIQDVRQTRQVLAVKDRDLFILTDTVTSTQPHQYRQNYSLYTPVRRDNAWQRLKMLQDAGLKLFKLDSKEHVFTALGAGLPGLEVRHIAGFPLQYGINVDQRPANLLARKDDPKTYTQGFDKRDRQSSDSTGTLAFSQELAVNWRGQGPQLLVTLLATPGRTYATEAPSMLSNLRKIAPTADMAGFTARFADGTPIGYLASVQPKLLQLDGLEAVATALLRVGDQGIALDCAQIAGVKPATTDFTFHLAQGKVVIDQPIYRPIQVVRIEPEVNVFTDRMTVKLSCATPGVEIRYTLDNSKPTPQSPLYTGPFEVKQTCRLKARAFRPGVTEDIWQEDGTHASVVYATVLRQEPLLPARQVATQPGLKYEYFEGVWTTLMATCLDQPAQTTGVTAKLLDVSPRQTSGAFGMRYNGFIEVPADGVYTFHCPREYTYPDNDAGYELRVFVDGREWYPAVRWHGHGTWSIALAKGKHEFRVAYVDARLKPRKVEFMWGFPQPGYTWNGDAPQLMLSGPGLAKQPIPDAMLCHE